MKLKYLLKVNCEDELKRAKEFEFSFHSSKHITVRVSNNKYTVSALIGKDYRRADNHYLINLMKEGIRRAMTLHLFLYEKPISSQQFELSVIDHEGVSERIEADFVPYSMISSNLLRPIPEQLKNTDFLQASMNITKTEKGSEIAALTAYLYSKSKGFETERFQNLWMAFNGFYSSGNDAVKRKDRINIERILQKYGLGKNICGGNQRNNLGKSPFVILKDVNESTFLDDIRNSKTETYQIIRNYIDKHLKIDLSVEGFMVGELSYHLRCNIFHANKPIQLVAFENDLDLKSLRLVNKALERFLDEHLIDLL